MSKSKVKREKFDWYKILLNCNNPEIFHLFSVRAWKSGSGKRVSNRRLAYYVLKSYYRTTTITQLAKKVGVIV